MKALKGKQHQQPLWQQRLGCVCRALSLTPLRVPAACGKYKREQEQEARQDFLEADQAWRVEHKAHKQQCAACGMWRVWQVASGKQRWPVAVAPLPPLTGKVCNENFLVKTKLKCEKMFNRIENKAEREVREGQRRKRDGEREEER